MNQLNATVDHDRQVVPSVSVTVVASLTGEMASRSLLTLLIEQQTVTVICGL